MGFSAADLALDLSDVSKVFRRRVHALRGIDMRVRRGEIFGLLGPNGAGKSTLVKILTTVISATTARGTMLGQPIGHKPTLARVGYLPEHHRFPEYLTGAQVVEFFGALSNVSRSERKAKAAELIEFVGMKDWARTPVKQYSKGMRQRIGIAQALVNSPDLVILDEPTDGVDPVGRRDIRLMLQALRDRGTTVFLNSHLLSELEMVCDRVAILVQGRVAAQGSVDELTVHRHSYEISIAGPEPDRLATLAREALRECTLSAGDAWTLPSGESITIKALTLDIRTGDPAKVQPIIDALRRHGLTLATVRGHKPSLEDLFMEAVQDPSTGKAFAPGAASSGGAR